MHAPLCGTGHNLRMILARLRVLYCALVARVATAIMLLVGASSAQPASLRT